MIIFTLTMLALIAIDDLAGRRHQEKHRIEQGQ